MGLKGTLLTAPLPSPEEIDGRLLRGAKARVHFLAGQEVTTDT